ncbi:MAG: hypothetical protein ACI8XO_002380 [Verrucomicrobiales bacterium]|jgi:hypothetical protein
MKFVIILGPLAVGKMTVGQELEKITGLKLFHNHMTIEMLLPFFDMKSASFKKLVDAFRIQIFEEVAKSDLEGLIFTYVWEFDQARDCDFIDTIVEIFERENASVYYVELEADTEERLRRNVSPNRLKHKPSKLDFAASREELLETDKRHVVNSPPRKFKGKNYIRIDNTHKKPGETAREIKQALSLPSTS